ncbi:MAG: hypothetical protein RIC55_00535 [Pirellulaceae bacterium]
MYATFLAQQRRSLLTKDCGRRGSRPKPSEGDSETPVDHPKPTASPSWLPSPTSSTVPDDDKSSAWRNGEKSRAWRNDDKSSAWSASATWEDGYTWSIYDLNDATLPKETGEE